MKKSRKRLLISSIAMLLVAMLALGTATFAWFTQNTTASANGIYAKTVKASNLKVSKNDHDWKTIITYTQGTSEAAQVMFPASSGNGTNWFTGISEYATAEMDGDTVVHAAGELKPNASPVTPADSNATYVFKQELNVKNDGDAGSGSIKDITIQWNWPTGSSEFVRVAIVPATSEGNLNIPEGKGFKDYVYAKSDTAYTGLTAAAGTGVEIKPQTTLSVSVPQLAPQEAAYYALFVWFEGQDAKCIDANAASTLTNLNFTVTGTPA